MDLGAVKVFMLAALKLPKPTREFYFLYLLEEF